jgi:putative two-component system response regulator
MEKFNILFVDDEEEILKSLNRTFCMDKNLNLFFSPSAEEGFKVLENNEIHVIISDQKMPVMSGVDFFKITKERYSDSLRILLTASTDVEHTISAINDGEIYRYINKPWDIIELRGVVFNALDYAKLKIENKKMIKQIEVHNIELEEKVIQRTREIHDVQYALIFSLAKLAESRDPETGDHLIRIREYCKLIAEKLLEKGIGDDVLNEKYIENIYQSSALHDIGKVGIPDHILLKPGKLTPEEFEIMKTHSTIGGKTIETTEKQLKKTVKKDSFLTIGKEIAYFHHEKWNGKGYPSGLSKDNIPLCARIIALADVYDALRSKRPYKEIMPHEKVREIILQEKNQHFDPDIVDVFAENEALFFNFSENHQ